MQERQDFAVMAGDNPPVMFALTRETDGAALDPNLLADIEWGLSAMPGTGVRDPEAIVTKRMSTGGIVVDAATPTETVVRVVLASADLELDPGQYVHQLRGVFAAGYRDTLAKGTVTVEHSPL